MKKSGGDGDDYQMDIKRLGKEELSLISKINK